MKVELLQGGSFDITGQHLKESFRNEKGIVLSFMSGLKITIKYNEENCSIWNLNYDNK